MNHRESIVYTVQLDRHLSIQKTQMLIDAALNNVRNRSYVRDPKVVRYFNDNSGVGVQIIIKDPEYKNIYISELNEVLKEYHRLIDAYMDFIIFKEMQNVVEE